MNIYWNGSVKSGSFTSTSSWVHGVVPGAADVAELTTSGATAFVLSPDTVLGLNVVSGAVVTTESRLTLTEGTATGPAATGKLLLEDSAQYIGVISGQQ
jgi:hypothetical protein